MHRKPNAGSKYRAGDEIFFKFDGLLLGTVKRVQFNGRKVRYKLTLKLECEVPESQIEETTNGAGKC